MTTILVPTSGTDTDASVFATAYSLALPLQAHLDFFHLRLTPSEAIMRAPHASLCVGGAIPDTFNYLRRQDETRVAEARTHFTDFCDRHPVFVQSKPSAIANVTAQWTEETNDAEGHFLMRARHSDLVVLGRPAHTDLMPVDLIETLLTQSGRPIVLAPRNTELGEIRTVVVGWRETAACARALTAAMPILERAERVILSSIEDVHHSGARVEGIHDLAEKLAWNGIAAEARVLSTGLTSTAERLTQAAMELKADLLVVGGFGHSRMREEVFGGVTRELLDECRLPLLLAH
jgi:nucleotide-binding universal stress UspA family protein